MMKRTPSRAPSPTPTSFSAISNYRNDSFRGHSKNPVPPQQPDYRSISRIHFDELGRYLAAYLAKSAPNSRTTARQKLTRLTIQQFHELSTDVYDELMRRKNENEVPFLPVREDFHPKRNQARQKLATLPASRFEDLSSDVYFELSRRYPEFKEDPSGRASASSAYDDTPAPDFYPGSPPRATNSSRTSGRTSVDRPSDSGYGGSGPSRKPSVDRRRTNESDYYPGRRSDDTYRRIDDAYGTQSRISEDSYGAGISSRRKPSQDTTRRSEDRDRAMNTNMEHVKRPSGSMSVSAASDGTVSMNPGGAQSATATSGMIIPTKSTIEEEYIEVPYGREMRESGATSIDDHDRSRETGRDGLSNPLTDGEPDSASDYPSPMSPPGGLSGLSARLKSMEDDDDDGVVSGTGTRSGDDYYDNKFGRSSVNSDRSTSGARMLSGRQSLTEDQEKLRREYEYKIATMQTQITTLQRDLGDTGDKDRRLRDSESRVKQLEEELTGLRRRSEEQVAVISQLQKDLDNLRDMRQREKDHESRRAASDEEELLILRERLEKLEDEKQNWQTGMDAGLVDHLRSELEGLMSELTDLSRRNDELMASKESDAKVIRELDNQLKDYKRKYEQAKTELRTVKATSQLYLQPPKFDDQLPYSPDGGILDIHITAFQSAIDTLLTQGRSNAPTRVLQPMKSVVNAVTAITDDLRMFERKAQRERGDVDFEALQALRDRAEATLSNLVVATKTHATSSGMSPVSLLDAAASHVSVTITEMGKMLYIRKATRAEQDKFASTQATPNSPAGGAFTSSLRSIEESRTAHQRKGSGTSVSSSKARYYDTGASPPIRPGDVRRRPPSANSSSEQTNSPPPIFDQQNSMSDDSGQAEGPEDNWAELTRYLDVQTGAIVVAIQGVLTGVRSATPSPSLNENLAQIITIVSSIVAVCKDNLPPNSVQQGNEILRDLSEHANKLSEVQAQPELTKEARQTMAKSSYAIANAMKALMKLS